MDIRRFGPGNRRPEGPPGTSGLTGQVIWSDDRGHVSELAFSRQGVITPHANPNATLFVVVSGGGWVQVGEERSRITHGEAVVWPAGVTHGAWTDGSEMRAIVIELPQGQAPVLDGVAHRSDAATQPARGALAERPADPSARDPATGEPW
ncbi:MAG: cupin domain-containing protein [Chloroflexota bacterium]